MDFSEGLDFLAWVAILAFFIRGFVHYSRIDKQNKAEDRNFGRSNLHFWFGVLLFPWAIRQAQKEHYRKGFNEQENHRQGAQ